MRWRRDRAAHSPVFKGFATLEQAVESLSRRRARHDLFTHSGFQSRISDPKYRPSLCLTRPGLSGVGFAQSVATYPGWLLRDEIAEIETATRLGYQLIRPRILGSGMIPDPL